MTVIVGTGDRSTFVGDATPARTTTLNFDLPETIIQEAGWGSARVGPEISPIAVRDRGQNSRYASNARYWPSGVWGLRPLQETYHVIQQTIDTQAFTFGPAIGTTFIPALGFLANAVIPLATEYLWNKDDLPGVSFTPDVLDFNDHVFRAYIDAGASWAQTIPITTGSQPLAYGGVGEHYTVNHDRIIESTANAPAEMGFYLRWKIPGITGHQKDDLISFYFGQYSLAIKGDGTAVLWENCHQAGTGTLYWAKRKTFRYCKPNDVTAKTHAIIVFPHRGLFGARHIVFSGAELDANEDGDAGKGGGADAASSSNRDILYTFDQTVRGGDTDESPGLATKAAPIKIDIRRGIRPFFTLQALYYPTAGFVVDHPWAIPVNANSPASTITATLTKFVPTGGALEPTVSDSYTATVTTTTDTPVVVFNFTPSTDRFYTPLLMAYAINRAPVVLATDPGKFSIKPAAWTGEIGTPDGRQEQVIASVYDPENAAPRLKTRGMLRSNVSVHYTPPNGDPAQDVVIIDGYTIRPQVRQLGHSDVTGHPAQTYPKPLWCAYDLTMTGMYERLTENSSLTMKSPKWYLSDPAASTDATYGHNPPWKVTDVIKDILADLGFTSGQIEIPDNPIRLFPGLVRPATDAYTDIMTDRAAFLMTLTHFYLFGQSLYWDANHSAPTLSGGGGAWTLLAPPPLTGSPPTSVITFLSGGTANPAKLRQYPGSFATDATGHTIKTFYLYPLRTEPIPPEKNHVLISAVFGGRSGSQVRCDLDFCNALSYKVPGMSVTPDPDSPHYIGREMKETLNDPSLYAYDDDRLYVDTYHNVAFVGRRFFDYTCRPRVVQTFRAPLVFIKDATTGRYRPPRYYDPVTLDTQTGYYIRSVRPDVQSDGFQWADYEIEKTLSYP